ncbi:MAG TPA: hypothetical protein VNG04_06880 [Candidatus Acidoferrum sp.]|nr:hypothetical protein [Candidatus Acidoferrum sp.]
MVEQTLHNLDGGDPEPSELEEQVDEWVRMIDRWVERLDQGMGGSADGADPATPPDSALEATHDTPEAEAG